MAKKTLAPTRKTCGQKLPFTREQVARIKAELERTGRLRDLAMFCTAVDTMLRNSDIIRLRMNDVCDVQGRVRPLFSLLMCKTRMSVTVQLSSSTREVLQRLIVEDGLEPSDYLFTSRCSYKNKPLAHSQCARLVKLWCRMAGIVDVDMYSTHSLRRTRATYIYAETRDVEAVRHLLGHSNLSATNAYLGVNTAQALDVGRKFYM